MMELIDKTQRLVAQLAASRFAKADQRLAQYADFALARRIETAE